MSESKPKFSAAGFTLLELLVVVSIIAMLSALVIPFIGSAIERGRMAKCAHNLRQLHLANTEYAGDKGTYVPAAEDMIGPNRKRWHGARKSGG